MTEDGVPREVVRLVIESGIEWYEQFFRSIGADPRRQPFVVHPTTEMIQRALDANNPVVALGNYEHFYNLTLFEEYCRGVGMTRVTSDRIVVVEIGVAHGILASMMMSKFPHANYVLVDSPQVLHTIAERIRTAFPQRRSLAVEKKADIASASLDDWQTVFLPEDFVGALAGKHVDVAWTFHGMNRFRDSQIARYFDLIQNKIRPRTFAFRNRYLNATDEGSFATRTKSGKGVALVDAQWTIREWALEPMILASPYVDSGRHPRYLEAVLQRLVPPDGDEARILAKRKFLAGIAVQSWVNILQAPAAYTTTWGIRPLRFQVDRGGTFWQFWDHARLAPGRDVFLMLMHYLDYCALGSGSPFEEWLFYAAVLKELHAVAPDAMSDTVLQWLSVRVREGAKSRLRPVPGWRSGYEILPELLPIETVRQIMLDVDIHRSLDIG